uniref:Serine racemase n=1 Tax=Fibrocapsa japonica TaxID=94617 RepID=A0A7S2UXC5_9STRA|mmetsp:Transcript_15412/g.22664  ORF Transcript_15412/g.22664 Transcript_15412/m.22664 type:complete len:465 (+) Transcript_15412:90-1484(+)
MALFRASKTSYSTLSHLYGRCTLASTRLLSSAVPDSFDEAKLQRMKSESQLPVNFSDVSTALYRIRSGIYNTECRKSYFLSEICGMDVHLKMDFTQFTGSFKERGARNALLSLSVDQRSRGVMAASAGNHALALAYHGGSLGIPVTCFMPTVAPITKVEKCRKLGANVVIHGPHIGAAMEYAKTNPEYKELKYINGYDDPEIVAGAGTMAIEILEQVPDTEVVVIPVGGAGLIAGMSLAFKTLKPEVQVIGVEPHHCASFTAALEAGHPSAPVDHKPTLADGLAVPVVGGNAFEVARHYVDRVELVDEKQIALAVLRLVENEHCVVEGGGATGLAGILPGGPLDIPELKGKKVVVPLCGGNIDTTTLGRVIDRGLAADSRLIRFIATLSDRPGGLALLTEKLAGVGASIKDIYHERAWLHTSIDMVQVKCVIETTGAKHAERVHEMLKDEGYEIIWGENSNHAW